MEAQSTPSDRQASSSVYFVYNHAISKRKGLSTLREAKHFFAHLSSAAKMLFVIVVQKRHFLSIMPSSGG